MASPRRDEADCAALTPPGFCLKSLPRQSGKGGGLAVLHQTTLTKNIAVSTQDFVFTAFEICEVRLPMMVILQCSLVFTVLHLVDRTS